MNNDRTIGVVLGLIVSAIVITENASRADSHGLSVFPDVFSLAVAPVAVYLLGRRRRQTNDSADVVLVSGVRVGAIAGGVFAVLLGVFSYYRQGIGHLTLTTSVMAFASVAVLSYFAGYAAAFKKIAV